MESFKVGGFKFGAVKNSCLLEHAVPFSTFNEPLKAHLRMIIRLALFSECPKSKNRTKLLNGDITSMVDNLLCFNNAMLSSVVQDFVTFNKVI